MARELHRILAPAGVLVASLNLDEPPTVTEPACLTRAFVERTLLDGLRIGRCRVAPFGPPTNRYEHLERPEAPPPIPPGDPSIMWVVARKP